MNMFIAFLVLCAQFGSLCAAVPLKTTHLADVEALSWYLIIAGFLAELFIMYLLLSHRESLVKIFGVTVFMNAVSIFMSSVTVFGVDATAALLYLPSFLTFVLTYIVGVITSVFVEVLIVQKVFPHVNRAKLILLLSLANIVSIGVAMYGVWLTRF